MLVNKEEITMGLLKVKNIKKIYATRFGNQKVEALKNVSLEVRCV